MMVGGGGLGASAADASAKNLVNRVRAYHFNKMAVPGPPPHPRRVIHCSMRDSCHNYRT